MTAEQFDKEYEERFHANGGVYCHECAYCKEGPEWQLGCDLFHIQTGKFHFCDFGKIKR